MGPSEERIRRVNLQSVLLAPASSTELAVVLGPLVDREVNAHERIDAAFAELAST